MKYYIIGTDLKVLWEDVSIRRDIYLASEQEKAIIEDGLVIREQLKGSFGRNTTNFNNFVEAYYPFMAVDKKAKEFLLSQRIPKYTFVPLEIYREKSNEEVEQKDLYEVFMCQTYIENAKIELHSIDDYERVILDENSVPLDIDLFFIKYKKRIGNVDYLSTVYSLICSEDFYKAYKKSKLKWLSFLPVSREEVCKDEIRKDKIRELRTTKYQFPLNPLKENLSKWIELIFLEEQPWSKIKGMYFQIIEYDNQYGIAVFGTKRFNKKDDTWAEEENFPFINDEILIHDELVNNMKWEECFEYITKAVEEKVKEKGIGKFKGQMGVGFADSNIKYITIK